jgi:hypothetical protein
MIADHQLLQCGGSYFGDYKPSQEDEAATDWESYWLYPGGAIIRESGP